MRIDLGQLSTEALSIELPSPAHDGAGHGATAAGAPQVARIASVEALRGLFTSSGEGWELSNAGCARISLDALSWLFGTVALTTDQPARLVDVALRGAQQTSAIELELSAAELVAQPLVLSVGDLRLSAHVKARGVRLQVGADIGRLSCSTATFHAFELRTGALRVLVPELIVSELVVDWAGEFGLSVGTAQAQELSLEQHGATLLASDVALAALIFKGRRLSLGQARVGRTELQGALTELFEAPAKRPGAAASGERSRAAEQTPGATAPSAVAATSDQRAASTRPSPSVASWLDLRLLDALSGRIDLDLLVDVAVPIIGHRRATHTLRLAVDDGAINYRALEAGLAALEDSLLDFSVRDDALVLERGLPLIATRGRGKPILRWDLTPEDLALARSDRVRLAVLPSYRPWQARDSEPRESEPPEGEGASGAFKLRELSLLSIDVVLALMESRPTSSGALRELTFANLTVRGQVHHAATGARPLGALQVGVASLRALITDLPLGPQLLRGRVELAALREAEIGFEDLRPRTFKATLEGLAIADLALA